MPSNTASYNFYLPTVGGDTNSWGGYLNSNWDDIDDLLDGTSAVDGIDIDGGTIDDTPIGGTTPAAGAFTTLSATGAVTLPALVGATGAAFKITHTDTDSVVEIYGGTEDNGAAALFYGDTHATKANDVEFYAQTTLTYAYDHSALTHTWSLGGTQMMQISSSGSIILGDGDTDASGLMRDVNNGIFTVAGGAGLSSGANMQFYGGSHATAANDIKMRTAGSTDIYHYDHSALIHYFKTGGTERFKIDGTISRLVASFGITEGIGSLSGTTPAVSCDAGNIYTWTLTGNSTPTDSLDNGDSVTLMINDGTAYTITWTSLVDQWIGGSAPTLATSGYSVVELWKVGGTVYGASVGDAS